jgi:Domain of unknown function (DUF1929)/Secretion system C-terminal sorting domain
MLHSLTSLTIKYEYFRIVSFSKKTNPMKKITFLLILSCFWVSLAYSQLNRKTLYLVKKNPATDTSTVVVTDTNTVKIAEKVGNNAGKWSPVYAWPLAAVHMSVLPNGKVLVWDDTQDDGAGNFFTAGPFHTSVWDPASNTHNAVPIAQRNPSNVDLFCASHVQLPNGDLLTATGPIALSPDTHIYSWRTDKWYRTLNINNWRYYPSVTTLSDGNVMILGGNYTDNFTPPLNINLDKAELFSKGKWTILNNTQMDFSPSHRGQVDNTSYFPWIQQVPNGQVFYAGPESKLRYISPLNEGSVSDVGERDNQFRDYGSYAMYDIGKILVAGGGNSLRSTITIDVTGGAPVIGSGGQLNYGRRQGNLTILSDGSVLATGGNSGGSIVGNQFDLASSVYAPEIWNSSTNTWIPLANMAKSRQYHSTAILVPDGRVILGGGVCNPCYAAGQNNIDAEYFSPPYLFKPDGSNAPRPIITENPQYITYDSTFKIAVNMPAATTIKKVHLIKLGSVTHATNFDQRLVPLTFTGTPQSLTVNAPQNGYFAPPGFYMLVIVSSAGAPSVAKIIQVGNGGEYPTPPFSPDGYSLPANIIKVDASAFITWKYPADKNVKHFEIEKLADDGTYKTVHTENASQAQKEADLDYQFKDDETVEGINTYRIKVVLNSEKAPVYFEKLSVKFDSENEFTVSPNPAKDYFDISLSSLKGKKATISVIDIAGQLKFKEQIQANPLSNRIDLNDFEAGQYFIRIETEGSKPVVKKLTVIK